MGFFSGLLGGSSVGFGTTLLGSVLGGAISSGFQNANNAKAMELQHNYSKDLFEFQNRNKYQFMVDDLNKAGLNPMLAVGGLQGSAGGTVTGTSSPVDVGHINSARAQAEANRIANINAKTELLRAEAERDEKRANIKLIEAQTNDLNTMTPLNSALAVAKREQIYGSIVNDARLISSQIRKLESGVALDRAEIQKTIKSLENIAMEFQVRGLDYQKLYRELYGAKALAQEETLNSYLGGMAVGLGTLLREAGVDIRGIFGSLSR